MVSSEAVATRFRSGYAGLQGEVAITPSNLSFLAAAEALYQSDNPAESAVLKAVNNLMAAAGNKKLPAEVQGKALVLGRLILSRFGCSSMDKALLAFFKSSPTPPRPGTLKKTIASLRSGNVAHVMQGIMNKVESHPVLRPSLTNVPKLTEANIAHLRSPYGIIKVKVTEEVSISMAWTRASQGGRVSWEFNKEGTVPPQEIERSHPNNFVAFGSGAYVSDSSSSAMPVGLTVHEGEEINTYLDHNNRGIVVINDGRLAVYDYQKTPWGNLAAAKGMGNFLAFYRERHSSVFQSHLLVHEGRSQVGTNSSTEQAYRRVLLALNDNNAALVYFDSPVTLYETAKILEQIPGIRSAVNLDTGINNCGRMKLGDETINQGCVSGRGNGGRLSSPVVLTKPSAKID
jgi:hypothetical protein